MQHFRIVFSNIFFAIYVLPPPYEKSHSKKLVPSGSESDPYLERGPTVGFGGVWSHG